MGDFLVFLLMFCIVKIVWEVFNDMLIVESKFLILVLVNLLFCFDFLLLYVGVLLVLSLFEFGLMIDMVGMLDDDSVDVVVFVKVMLNLIFCIFFGLFLGFGKDDF